MENSHILDIEVWITGLHAAMSEVSRLYKRTIGVQIVYNWVSVLLLRGCEDHYLKVLIGGF